MLEGRTCNAQKYSPGVLVGNWYEEQCAKEDHVSLYRAQKANAEASRRGISAAASGRTDAAAAEALKAQLQQPTTLSSAKDGVVRFGEPLLIVNQKTKCALALDAPQGPTQTITLSATGTLTPQVRNTWTVQRCEDGNNKAFNHTLKEADVLHYGQRVRISNELASADGFLYVHSALASGQRASEAQSATASYAASADNVFIVGRPHQSRDHVLDGAPVCLGAAVSLLHSITNMPLGCSDAAQRTSFGMEKKVACSYVKESFGRSTAAVITKEENMFCFTSTGAAPGPTLRASLSQTRTAKVSQEASVLDVFDRIREKALALGGRLGFRSLAIALGVACCEHRITCLTRGQLAQHISRLGVALTSLELDMVMKRMDHTGNKTVSAQEFLAELRGNMPQDRMNAVALTFQQLVVEGQGSVEYKDMFNLYRENVCAHPDVRDGLILPEEAVFDFENSWPSRVNSKLGTVTINEFIEYYNDISPSILDDARFFALLGGCWMIPETDAYRRGDPCVS
ncbi:EF hand family protein [Strigomonas culicis]|uniref:EF hand family protein n=1 Tax=Strigomonas culicis TaxID=28005 RepID=S9VUS3_9TRYP|nr:EF hand family protein [Strigomonas culicis]|eukprot:EPY27025.1 EF hand family protein [Strigomonas culicis]